MKCNECKYCKIIKWNGGVVEGYCEYPPILKEYPNGISLGYGERHSNKLKIKTSPRCCPLKEQKKYQKL